MGTFVISKRNSGHYKYEFTSRKGKTIFTSINFELRFECEEHIELLKSSMEEVRFMKFKSKNGKFYFTILMRDKEIGVSRKYSTLFLLERGMTEVTNTVASAEYLDFSYPFVDFQD